MVRRPNVAVVADSSGCLPPDLLSKWNITLVPHALIIDGRTYRDGVDIKPGDFYRLLRHHRAAFTTAAPTPQEFLDAFLAARQYSRNTLCVTLSANLSATYQSALAAAQMADGKLSAGRVEVVDSRAAAGASGLIALAAARWAHLGYGLDLVAAKVRGLLPKVNLLAFLDTLYYLSRGGRLGRIKAWTGTLLGTKPLAELSQGEARLLARPRSRQLALDPW